MGKAIKAISTKVVKVTKVTVDLKGMRVKLSVHFKQQAGEKERKTNE